MTAKLLLSTLSIACVLASCTHKCDVSNKSGVVPGSSDDFEKNVPNVVYFKFDSSEISSQARKKLEAQAAWLKTYTGMKAILEGHTDSRGTEEYNIALGAARGNSAMTVMKRNGVSERQMTVVSYGKQRLANMGTTEGSHAQNRRVVTKVESATR